MRHQAVDRLAQLGALAAKTEAAERNIKARAERRLDEIAKALEKARPRVMLDDAAADEYQSLILERGKLSLVVARARDALGE